MANFRVLVLAITATAGLAAAMLVLAGLLLRHVSTQISAKN